MNSKRDVVWGLTDCERSSQLIESTRAYTVVGDTYGWESTR